MFSICLHMRVFLLHFVSMCLQSSWECFSCFSGLLGLCLCVCLCDWRRKGQQVWKMRKTLFAFFLFTLGLGGGVFLLLVNVKSILQSKTHHYLWLSLFSVFPLRSTVLNFLIYLLNIPGFVQRIFFLTAIFCGDDGKAYC